jgi:dipeptidyl-peptidase 4
VCKSKAFVLAIVSGLLLAACQQSEPISEPKVTEADYARAVKLLHKNLAGKIRNAKIVPHWIGTQGTFWYRWEGEASAEYFIVDAARGEQRTAFNDHGIKHALATVLEEEHINSGFKVDEILVMDDSFEVTVTAGKATAHCTIPDGECSVVPLNKPQSDWIVSPKGNLAAFSREHNLWLRDLNTGEERQLTTDGSEYYAYGAAAEQSQFGQPYQATASLNNSYWSPDGRWLIVQRLDEREVESYSFVEWAPQDGSARPKARHVKVPLLGDSHDRIYTNYIFDINDGSQRKIEAGQGFSFGHFNAGNNAVAWSDDNTLLYLLAETEGGKVVRLLEIELATTAARIVIEEREEHSGFLTNTHISKAPNVRILNSSQQLIWYSQRDGWGHLYLYDLKTGELKNRITAGDWAVWDIVHVDETKQQLYFTAGGRETERDPYYRHLYRTSFDGGALVLLTPENTDHEIDGPLMLPISTKVEARSIFSPDSDYFVDSYSTVKQAPTFVVRSTEDGHVSTELGKADASALYAAGWRDPERVALKAADGETDIYAVVYFPRDYDPDKKYPVIDAVYGGQNSIIVPRTFSAASGSGYTRSSLSELGFVVVSIDGRGTHFRSKAFQEFGYGSFADTQLEDHIAAIKQLAQHYPFMDIERVGVYGHSNGGYVSARAILKHPEFYKVAVSSAGSHRYHGLPGTAKFLLGIPDYGEGRRLRPEPSAIPQNYEQLDNATFANGLTGKLLLVFGDMDTAALPGVNIQLMDALIKNNKRFDLLYLPNRTHAFFGEEYFKVRLWDYFVEHLLKVEPPLNYKIEK